ncbi:hypothetical protein ZWY2020_051821 [Hordeum vulgare]|nr:hypothetical protein ZWY2020_051821 [Hordeum vulgare]
MDSTPGDSWAAGEIPLIGSLTTEERASEFAPPVASGHERHENVDIQTVLSEINEEFEGRENMSPGHAATGTAVSKLPENTITYTIKGAKRQPEATDATNLAKKQQRAPLMVMPPPHCQAKPSANIKQNDGKNKKKHQRAEEGEDSKSRVSEDSSAGSGNTESDNDFNPANGSDAGEDESDHVLQEQEMHQAMSVEAGSHEVCKSHQGYIEFEVALDTEIHCCEMAVDDKVVEPVLSQQEIRVQTERNATTTDGQEKAIIAMEQQGSPITGDQEQYLEKTGSTSSSSVAEEEEVRFQGAAHVKWEHERKDPPIKSDHPPDPSKETRKMSEPEQRIIEQRKRDAAISVRREASKGENRKLEKNPAVSSTSCTCESLEFLLPKTLAPEEEKALFLGSLLPDEVHSYNELVVRGGMDFQDFKTAFTMEKEDNFNKEVDVCPSKLQLDSPYMSTCQSSEITPANIISIKRSLKWSTRLYRVTSIPTFEHQRFIHMDKAKGLHDYLMSDEGEKECRNANLYKSAVREDCITGEIMMDQLQRGGKGQMEATVCNALFEEWTEHKQYNTSDKAILKAEFANLVLGLEYKDGGLKEFNEDDSLQQFEASVKGINLLDKKLVIPPDISYCSP